MTDSVSTRTIRPLAEAVAAAFGTVPQVAAVALAGSYAGRVADARSDIDLYVYADTPIPVDRRTAIMLQFTDQGVLDNQVWEPGDEWIDAQTGVGVDIIYRTPRWIDTELDRVLVRHEAAIGYSTCLWCNVLTSTLLYDQDGWYQRLQERVHQPYPAGLQRAIIAKNHPILRHTIFSLLHQLELAVLRHDLVSMQHRITAILASYFDIVFAVNKKPHPGEKRLVEHVLASCSKVPPTMPEQIEAVFGALTSPGDGLDVIHWVNTLLDGLDAVLVAEGFG